MIYPFSCSTCNLELQFQASIHDGPPDAVECPSCAKSMQRIFGCAAVIAPGRREDYGASTDRGDPALGINLGEKAGRTVEQQHELYRRNIRAQARIAAETRRSTSKEARNMDCRKIAVIPREAWVARTRQHGKNYWFHDDPKALAKRDGFLLEDNV